MIFQNFNVSTDLACKMRSLFINTSKKRWTVAYMLFFGFLYFLWRRRYFTSQNDSLIFSRQTWSNRNGYLDDEDFVKVSPRKPMNPKQADLLVQVKRQETDNIVAKVLQNAKFEENMDDNIDSNEVWFDQSEKRLTKFEEKYVLLKKSCSKHIVYSCDHFCGGLADRFDGIMGVFLWALLTDSCFHVQYDHPCNLNNFLKPNGVIDWDMPFSLDKVNYRDFIHPLGKFQKELKQSIQYSNISIGDQYPADAYVIRLNENLFGEFKGNPIYKEQLENLGFPEETTEEEAFIMVYDALFKMTPTIEEALNDFKQQLEPESKLICAQIRIPDNSPISYLDKYAEQLNNVWNFLKSYQKQSTFKYFVTTNFEALRERAKDIFGDELVDTKGPTAHIDIDKRDLACQGHSKVILDFEILSQCDVLLISGGSGYGRLAAARKHDMSQVFKFHIRRGLIEDSNGHEVNS